jgi:DNA-binding NarL/FixJ family response regulator
MNHKPRLTIMQILKWADAYFARTGEWPSCSSGDIPGSDTKWDSLDAALRKGCRGLPITSLNRLLQKHRGKRPGWTPHGYPSRRNRPQWQGRDPRGRKKDLDRRRQLLQLRSEGLTFKEIALRLGVTRQAVEQLYYAAMEEQG